MSLLTPTPESAIPPVPVWRVSVHRYHEMIRAGSLTEADRLELLDGWLVPKMTQNPLHRGVVFRIREALREALPTGWYCDAQVPITLTTSEPEPDVVVVRGRSDDYIERHPGPEDVALVVEVADSTLAQDRLLKKRVYAQAAIPVYWLVNLVERRIEVFTDPAGAAHPPDYRGRRDYGAGDELPLIVEGMEIGKVSVGGLLPRLSKSAAGGV